MIDEVGRSACVLTLPHGNGCKCHAKRLANRIRGAGLIDLHRVVRKLRDLIQGQNRSQDSLVGASSKPDSDFRRAFERIDDIRPPRRPDMITAQTRARLPEVPDIRDLDADDAVLALIRYAAQLPASDLFLTTIEDQVTLAVRHLGVLAPLPGVFNQRGTHLINSVKAQAGMELAQRYRPQDGRWACELDDGRRLDLRISTIPTLYGEAMSIRLLDGCVGLLAMSSLGLHQRQYDDVISWLRSPSGLILITGPTGAGKTTTAYACLHHLNNGTRRINTIEDPIEYVLEGVCQSQVDLRRHLDFPELLRGVLRQSPDVIKIGEIRDPITAATAVRAANSGSLVFATLHAPTAAAAIDSMLALGVHPHFLATCLRGVLAQRLVRTLCANCKSPVDLSGATSIFDDVKSWLRPGEGEELFAAHGCGDCHQQGYVGQIGVFEVLAASEGIRQYVFEGRSTREIHDKAVEEGMLGLREAALLDVARGVTSVEEVVRCIPTEHIRRHESITRGPMPAVDETMMLRRNRDNRNRQSVSNSRDGLVE